jgi:hypothetical protein
MRLDLRKLQEPPEPNIPTLNLRPLQPVEGRNGITSIPVSPEEQYENQRSEWLHQKMLAGEVEAAPPTFWEKFKENIPQMAGGTVGGLAGAKVGAKAGAKIPAGHPLLKGGAVLGGAVLGAGIGGMGGKGYQQYYRMTRPGAKYQPLGELYTDQAIAGIEEAASELAGRGIAKVGGKLLAPVKKRLLPGAKGLSHQLLKRGAHLTPAQMTESRIIDTVEGMAEKSFFGGNKLQRLKTLRQPAAFSKYVDDIVEQIAKGTKTQLSPEEVGDLLLDTIGGKRTAFKATAKAAYAKVDRLSKGTKVSLVELKNFARKTMKTAATRKGIGSTQAGDTLLKKVLQLDDLVSFKQAQSLRSALIDERSAMAVTRDKALGLAKQFTKLTDEAMDAGGKTLGKADDAVSAWRVANKFYREGQEKFNKKIIKSLSKSLAENPEVAVKKIFRPQASKQIKAVKELVDNRTWQQLKTAYLEQLIRDTSDADGVVLGKSFLNKLNKMGDETLKTIYNGQEIASIRSIGKMGEMLQKPTGGSGGMVIQLMQAGAAINLLTGGIPDLTGESATILFGPPVLSRMLANPIFSKYLSSGLRMPRSSPAAAALVTRLVKAKLKIEKEMRAEKQSPKEKERTEISGRFTKPKIMGGWRGLRERGYGDKEF